ncbi:hypothetical protein BHM03_00041265, partial [Ensete ventricosum]
ALALLHPHFAAVVTAPALAAVAHCGWQPPCQGAATPTTGAAAPAGDRAGCGRQPLLGNLSREIVYPYIIDPDGEDEGDQASSLAVSTRWISVVKLLQSDLATLAQREGG